MLVKPLFAHDFLLLRWCGCVIYRVSPKRDTVLFSWECVPYSKTDTKKRFFITFCNRLYILCFSSQCLVKGHNVRYGRNTHRYWNGEKIDRLCGYNPGYANNLGYTQSREGFLRCCRFCQLVAAGGGCCVSSFITTYTRCDRTLRDVPVWNLR